MRDRISRWAQSPRRDDCESDDGENKTEIIRKD